MNRILAACSLVALLVGVGACGNSTPSTTHKKAPAASGGVITSMAYTQSMDTGRSCTHTPAQAECATQWTIAYRDTTGRQHTASVTEVVYDRCLRGFPGAHYPACAKRGRS
jgi:hypothetical protein